MEFHPDWYAAFVATGNEERVRSILTYCFPEGIRAFIPTRVLRERRKGKWHTILRPLFPGYILLNGQIGVKEYYICKNIPGLWKLLRNDSDLLPIPSLEIHEICRLINHGEVIGPSSLIKENENISVLGGPLMGMEGRIKSIDGRKGRAKVRITFLGEERIIELAVELLARK